MTTCQLVAPRRARAWIRGGERALSLSTLLVTLAGAAPAQLITVKTVPLAQGDQFEIFPSQTRGMGGVSIARADTLLDPFLNPATGARLRGARFFGSPTFYSVSNEAGGGRTLPIGAFLGFGAWYAGLSVALQEVAAGRPNAPGPIVTFDRSRAVVDSHLPAPGGDERSHANAFAFALLGRDFPRPGCRSRAASSGPGSRRSTPSISSTPAMRASGSPGTPSMSGSACSRTGRATGPSRPSSSTAGST